MKLLALFAAILLPPQEKNEAEELYKKMEEKIVNAKTFQVKCRGKLASGNVDLIGRDTLWSGQLIVDEENRIRLDMEEETRPIFDGKTVKSFTSNGSKAVFVKATTERKEVRFDTPPTVGRLIRARFARFGFRSAIGSSETEANAKEDPGSEFPASDFKLGRKETVRDRECQAVEYTLTRKDKRTSSVTVWIDVATFEPLKRMTITVNSGSGETCAEFKFDEKIDAAKFEVPKETR
ncbi:MAG TPA: hypothetical protein VFS19_01905 [Planctomycetota bacterium]|nr:hypothetical protein [Planctomycetota bacterium]